MADEYDDLEIGLHHYHGDSYLAILRYRRPEGQFDFAPEQENIQIDREALLELGAQPEAYGRLLAQSLFGGELLKAKLAEYRAASGSNDRKLRLRLFIDSTARALHGVRWELLRDPADDDQRLITNSQFLFSRFLAGNDYRTVKLHPRADLRALVVVANPAGLEAFDGLDDIDVEGELARARDSLKSMVAAEITSAPSAASDGAPSAATDNPPGAPVRASLPAIMSALRDGYDILYLACHGHIKGSPPGSYLYLEDEQGGLAITSGAELVAGLRDLNPELRPRLIVLNACQSASSGSSVDDGALSSLGPVLAQDAAIPAVIAMQGDISMDTVAAFMPVFFEKLAESGQVDEAMTSARAAVAHRDDWWSPALYMRLRNGRIWYEPRFAGDQAAFSTWPDLTAAIKSGRCTPILGPDLLNFLMGSPQDIAGRWAEEGHFPMAPHNIRSLPQVARYVATMQSRNYPPNEISKYFRWEILQRHRDELADSAEDVEQQDLPQLMKLVGAMHRQDNERDPFRVLAQIPAKIFINTNPDKLLIHALRETGKKPRIAICPWNDLVEQPETDDRYDPRSEPTVDEPLVYYLFGWLDQRESMVISEDDYFDFLIWISQERTLGMNSQIPHAVSRAWSANALMFLGFQADDWAFRVLLHAITNPLSSSPRRPKSVAVQIDPEEGPFLEPELAADYMEKYLRDFRNRKSSVYWGSPNDFINDLWQREADWRKEAGQGV